jgi:hypothetical protein
MTAQAVTAGIMALGNRRLYAKDNSVETPQTGFPVAKASPLTALTLIRKPVKEPGPQFTAKTSISVRDIFAERRTLSHKGMRV